MQARLLLASECRLLQFAGHWRLTAKLDLSWLILAEMLLLLLLLLPLRLLDECWLRSRLPLRLPVQCCRRRRIPNWR
jgi:hypothetical protein